MSKDIDTELTSDSNRGLIVVPGIISGPYGRLFDEVTSSRNNKETTA